MRRECFMIGMIFALGWAIASLAQGAFDPPTPSYRVLEVEGSKVKVILWEQKGADGRLIPFYAISLDGKEYLPPKATSYEILLKYAEFDPLYGEPSIPPGLAAEPSSAGVYIVQFVTQPLEEYRQHLQHLGCTLYHFLANHSYLVAMDEETKRQVQSLPFVRWVGAYHPAYKLPVELLQEWMAGQLQSASPTFYNIQVFEEGLVQKQRVAERIRALGGRVEELSPNGYLLKAALTRDQLLAVLKMKEVLFVDPWSAPEPDMDLAREIGGANFIESTLGFTGQGVRAEVLDTGLRTTHVDFQTPPPLIHGSNDYDTYHGTSTFGITFGDGIGNRQGRGLLPDAEQPIFSSFYYLTDRYRHTAELVDPNGPYRAVFQTNSWGSARTRRYTTQSMLMDDIIFRNDILITQSQSNAGNQDSRPEAWAKNVVSVGGVYHYNTLSKSDDRWGGGSSTGPAEDGRVKPDLVHFYDWVFTTTDSSNYAYRSDFNGTSAATPIVAGHFGLLFQMWHEGVFPGFGGRATVFESRPHAMTAKALIINSADQYPFPPATDLDRFRQGWGMPNIRNLYEWRYKMLIVDESEVLRNLQSKSYEVYVPTGEPALRATLCYMDLPGTTSSSLHRINDLTLKVTSPTGTVYWGNNGLIDGVWSTPGGLPDTKNTVENVFVQNPSPGIWTIEVIASEVNRDAHLETTEVDADFALVVSGVRQAGDVDGDGCVGDNDLSRILLVFGQNCSGCPEDQNGDGVVNDSDLALVLSYFGQGCR